MQSQPHEIDDYKTLKLKLSGYLKPGQQLFRNVLFEQDAQGLITGQCAEDLSIRTIQERLEDVEISLMIIDNKNGDFVHPFAGKSFRRTHHGSTQVEGIGRADTIPAIQFFHNRL